ETMTVSDGVLYAGSDRDGIYRTTDHGLTWIASNNGLPQPYYQVNDLDADGSTVLACFWGDGIYRSDDAGATWLPKKIGLPSGWGQYLFAVDGEGQHSLAGFLRDGALRSTDAGDLWIEPASGIAGTGITGMVVDAARLVVTVGGDRIFYTDDDGDTWESTQTGIPATAQVRAIATAATDLFVGTQYEGVLRSKDQGGTWMPVNTGFPEYNGTAGNQYREVGGIAGVADVVVVGTGVGFQVINGSFVITGGGMFRSTDDGDSWVEANVGYPVIGTDNFGTPVYDPAVSVSTVGSTVLTSGFERGIFRSTNQGQTWSAANTGLPVSGSRRPEFSRFVELDGVIYGGAIGFSIGTGGFGLFRSTDGGASWALANNGIPAGRSIDALLVHGGSLYACVNAPLGPAIDDGVYRSTDQGGSWELLGTGLDALSPGELAASGARIFAGTSAFGVWRLDELDPADVPTPSVAGFAAMEPPVPNPARNECSVAFTLSTTEPVALTLHDAGGRLLRTLDVTRGPGRHVVPISVRELPAGVYYLSLRGLSTGDGGRSAGGPISST
ncbi:MAG: hypothetical protein KC729_21115, partial [Candidatus Eisenbacteria bacterium]|nr:hypothetical protein [Candidatus Eisenbacteria bacterium]